MIQALVIDDVRQMADSLCQMLQLLEVQARPAYGVRAGLLALNEFKPDVVFLDLNMPGVSGFEVLAYVRRDPRFENIPVVVVTSDDQSITRQRAIEGGALDLIVKPASFEAIEAALKAAKLIP